MSILQEHLTNSDYLILDGAMGTRLMEMGLTQGAPPEEWNVLYPERIQQVHAEYIAAGTQIILTNSFGGTHYRLKLHDLQERVYELNKAAAACGRAAAAAAPHPVVVAGSMGPTGELMEPMGTMSFTDAQEAFAAQARGLADGGADVLWIETMSDLQEVQAAVAGARSVTDLPVAATLSFDTNGRTMMGVTAAKVMDALGDLGLAAIGANCGNNLPDTMAAVAEMHRLKPEMPLIAKANAGIPRFGSSGGLEYDGTPQVMAGYAYHVRQMGARLIGGCCGSTPAHIAKMSQALAGKLDPADLIRPQGSETMQKERDASSSRGGDRPRRRTRRRRS